MKEKLVDRFGDEIEIVSSPGQSDMVVFRQRVSSILKALYDTHLTSDSSCSEAETSEYEDKKRIIRAAAELIISEVKDIPRPPDGFFPSLDDIADNENVRFK